MSAPGMPGSSSSENISVSWAFHAQQCLGFTVKRCNKQQTSSQRLSCGCKQSVDERGRRRMARIVRANRWETSRQITAQYNSGVQNGISERTTHHALSRVGYCSRQQHRFHSYQLKTRTSGSSWHAITKAGQLRSGETSLGT